jgi:hypothetical protein
MNNSVHIFKELNKLLPGLKERYKSKDIFYIGLRLNDKQVAKVEVFFEDLLNTIFNIIDNKHPALKDEAYKGLDIQSLFVCDISGTTVYDSKYYQVYTQKYNLKKDKDIRLLQFKQLDESGKNQVIELLVAQIQESYHNEDLGIKPDDKGPSSNWGEMPWDFQK